jgi:hypothetical protein
MIGNERDYNKFIAETAVAYEKLSGGESIDDFIRTQYPKRLLRIPGLDCSLIVGPLAPMFGANKKGENYLSIIDYARKRTNTIDCKRWAVAPFFF